MHTPCRCACACRPRALVSPERLCAHPTQVCLCMQTPRPGEPREAVYVHTPRRCACACRPRPLVSPERLCVCAHPTQVCLCVQTPPPGERREAVCVCTPHAGVPVRADPAPRPPRVPSRERPRSSGCSGTASVYAGERPRGSESQNQGSVSVPLAVTSDEPPG